MWKMKVLRSWGTVSDMTLLFYYFTPFQNYLWQKVWKDWLYSGSCEDQRIPVHDLFSESEACQSSVPQVSGNVMVPWWRYHFVFKIKYICQKHGQPPPTVTFMTYLYLSLPMTSKISYDSVISWHDMTMTVKTPGNAFLPILTLSRPVRFNDGEM